MRAIAAQCGATPLPPQPWADSAGGASSASSSNNSGSSRSNVSSTRGSPGGMSLQARVSASAASQGTAQPCSQASAGTAQVRWSLVNDRGRVSGAAEVHHPQSELQPPAEALQPSDARLAGHSRGTSHEQNGRRRLERQAHCVSATLLLLQPCQRGHNVHAAADHSAAPAPEGVGGMAPVTLLLHAPAEALLEALETDVSARTPAGLSSRDRPTCDANGC